MSVSDPSARLGCHVSSATLPGLAPPAPSLLPLTFKITWREFFNRQRMAIHKDGFALVLTKAEIVTNEGLASVRTLCSGSRPCGDALAQRKVEWTGRGEEGLPSSSCSQSLITAFLPANRALVLSCWLFPWYLA